ncbi:LAQU0S05e03862g1_1 [Lachancea quebecensis]|uniref:LAQU0S05e03862g1_1 n=1 Tax=Lachancea quebecensis TaxID=1654605 RepID=A0A0P1KQS9_9SACH|nr:LAQU0S05e03862g1_1 [Lachancea quebecensis]
MDQETLRKRMSQIELEIDEMNQVIDENLQLAEPHEDELSKHEEKTIWSSGTIKSLESETEEQGVQQALGADLYARSSTTRPVPPSIPAATELDKEQGTEVASETDSSQQKHASSQTPGERVPLEQTASDGGASLAPSQYVDAPEAVPSQPSFSSGIAPANSNPEKAQPLNGVSSQQPDSVDSAGSPRESRISTETAETLLSEVDRKHPGTPKQPLSEEFTREAPRGSEYASEDGANKEMPQQSTASNNGPQKAAAGTTSHQDSPLTQPSPGSKQPVSPDSSQSSPRLDLPKTRNPALPGKRNTSNPNPFRVISVTSKQTEDVSPAQKLQTRHEYLARKCIKLQREIQYLSDLRDRGAVAPEDARKINNALGKLQEYLDLKTKERYEIGVLLSRQLRREIDRGENGQFWVGH